MNVALTLPGVDAGIWQVRTKHDRAGVALYDRHYSRRTPGGDIGPPGRRLIFVTPCERAVWCSHWPYAEMALDKLDAYRCFVFRNEGAGLSSMLILEAMALTERLWGPPPPDGWITWVNKDKIASNNPGYCFKQAGWTLDRDWTHRHLVRLRK